MFDIKQYKSELIAFCDFTEIYDLFRLVDPQTSEVYLLKNGKAVHSGELPCYTIWKREEPCANCVSLRTCRDKKQYFKLEYLNGAVLMIVTKPVMVEGRLFSLELVTDVTNSMVVHDEFHCEQTGISQLIEMVNRLSITDSFTGLYNNSYMKSKITGLSQGNHSRPLSMIVIDIDHFKQVNDQYGHMAGDVVIQKIAKILDEFSSHSGYSVGRMGGDEFCIIFEDCLFDEAERLSRQITEKIRECSYEGHDQTFSVDVSIGIGEYIEGENAYAFIDRIDRAMYEAKRKKIV